MSILMDKLYDTGMTAQGLWPFIKGFLRRVCQKAAADCHLGVHQAHPLERKKTQPQSRSRVTMAPIWALALMRPKKRF